jgi:DNA-binding XRE family transcriptional regulator
MCTAGSLIHDRRHRTLVDGVYLTLVSAAFSTAVYAASDAALAGAFRPLRTYELAPPQVHIASSNQAVSTNKRASADAAPVATVIQELLDRLDISKASLAQWLGVSRPTLYAWTNGGEVRDSNLERITALGTAVDGLVRSTADGKLPPLWQHQRLPKCGTTFAQGMRTGFSPGAMAAELQAIWVRDAEEIAAVEALFRRQA